MNPYNSSACILGFVQCHFLHQDQTFKKQWQRRCISMTRYLIPDFTNGGQNWQSEQKSCELQAWTKSCPFFNKRIRSILNSLRIQWSPVIVIPCLVKLTNYPNLLLAHWKDYQFSLIHTVQITGLLLYMHVAVVWLFIIAGRTEQIFLK